MFLTNDTFEEFQHLESVVFNPEMSQPVVKAFFPVPHLPFTGLIVLALSNSRHATLPLR
jgi:hypothetical protein